MSAVDRDEAPAVPDAGLQAERTALAWQRTALVLAATAAAVLRLVAYRAGAVATVACAVVAIAAVAVLWITRRRYRSTVHAVRQDVDDEPDAGPSMPGAKLPTTVVAATLILGLAEICSILLDGAD